VATSDELNAMPLEIEFRVRKRLGGWQDAHHAIGVTTAGHSLSILTSIKVKAGQKLLLRLGHEGLALTDIPASVGHVEKRGADFVYHLQLDLAQVHDVGRNSANRVLRILHARLQPARVR